jgi:hypothetical protein
MTAFDDPLVTMGPGTRDRSLLEQGLKAGAGDQGRSASQGLVQTFSGVG